MNVIFVPKPKDKCKNWKESSSEDTLQYDYYNIKLDQMKANKMKIAKTHNLAVDGLLPSAPKTSNKGNINKYRNYNVYQVKS